MTKKILSLLALFFIGIGLVTVNVGAGLEDKCISPEMFNPADGLCYCPDGSIDYFRAGCLTSALGGKDEVDTSGIISLVQSSLIYLASAIVIYGGIMYSLSLGDENKKAKAKRILITALIGLAIVILAKTITMMVSSLV